MVIATKKVTKKNPRTNHKLLALGLLVPRYHPGFFPHGISIFDFFKAESGKSLMAQWE